jgi:hypothetical protein
LAEDVVELRSLHQTLDQSVAAAYGWHDLDVALGFHPSERFGVRWLPHPNAQREIERRLLVLNVEHAGR